jgi:hypothetical protein
MNVGYMEYNKMRELNVNEIEEVNGGMRGLSWFLFTLGLGVDDWGSASYEDMMTAP